MFKTKRKNLNVLQYRVRLFKNAILNWGWGWGFMKGLLLAILGAIVGWLLWGFFTRDFETDALFLLILGISIGYSIGKKESTSTK
jgi:uncharacterized membrane protein YbjE (DUF340 family)